MRFEHDRVCKFLLKNGVIATLRTYPYERKVNESIIVNIKGRKFRAKIDKVIKNPTLSDLRRYVLFSGFSSTEEWLKTAISLHRTTPTRLVIVKLEGGMER